MTSKQVHSWLLALQALPLADLAIAQSSPLARAVASGRSDAVYLAPATEPYEALPLGNGRLRLLDLLRLVQPELGVGAAVPNLIWN